MPGATVAIVTRNRLAELRLALASATEQVGDVEVIVIDDGSTDGTAEMVGSEFPEVELRRFDVRAGLVVRRNDAARLARAPTIVSLDDDAVFSSPHTVSETLRDFDDPRVGAVAIPYDELDGERWDLHQQAPDDEACWVAPTFRGTAYAVRRDVFLALGGFREAIVHQGEEDDYCIRLLAAGYVVRIGRAPRIHHRPSSARDLDRMDTYGRRNELLWAYTHFPMPIAAALMVGYPIKGLFHGLRVGRPYAMVRGIGFGVRACWDLRHERHPVAWRVATLERRMRRAGVLRLSEVEAQLPARTIVR